jgi:hypothetical protein
LRDSDARELKEKGTEVDRLKEEVERLGGEVEVLKGVVEEGLRERRATREINENGDEQGGGKEELETDPEDELESKQPAIPRFESMPSPPPDRTVRTDHATLGSSNVPVSASKKLVDAMELERISVELEERRSYSSHHSRPRSQVPSSNSDNSARATSPSERSPQTQHQPQMPASRPAAPTPAHASRRVRRGRQVSVETPFPQIRGGHLERLFFSAPDHNAETCRVCHRRRRNDISSSCLPLRQTQNDDNLAEDLSHGTNGEGLEDAYYAPKCSKTKGKQREHVTFVDGGVGVGSSPRYSEVRHDRLPPQTVLARVLRELEDEFTHYKRCAILSSSVASYSVDRLSAYMLS